MITLRGCFELRFSKDWPLVAKLMRIRHSRACFTHVIDISLSIGFSGGMSQFGASCLLSEGNKAIARQLQQRLIHYRSVS